jgi:hypothetical protein
MDESAGHTLRMAAQHNVHTFAAHRLVGFSPFSPVPPEGHRNDVRHGAGKHFPGFEFFLLPSRVHARSSASNANRSALAIIKNKEKGAK